MLSHRRNAEAMQRAADRRQREDSAARLRTEVPRLESLRLELEERRGGGVVAGTNHIRRIVVESAPALFFIPCGDRGCKDGGHDLTREVMRALQEGSTRFEGEDACNGSLGSGQCSSVLRYVAVASFR